MLGLVLRAPTTCMNDFGPPKVKVRPPQMHSKARRRVSNCGVHGHLGHLDCGDIASTIFHIALTLFREVGSLTKENNRPTSFPLRLPFTMRRQAIDIAEREGLSLNQFISLAVAEKITRLEHVRWPDQIDPHVSVLIKS